MPENIEIASENATKPDTEQEQAEKSKIDKQEIVYKQYVAKVTEMEQAVKFTITLFETGKAKSEKYGTVVLEDPSKAAQIIVSLFSSASIMWGNLRAMSQQAEVHRKFYESSLYAAVKKDYSDKGKKFTQKDLETDSTVKNKDKILTELKWDMLYARITACKDAFSEQLRTLNMLQQMRFTELRNWGA